MELDFDFDDRLLELFREAERQGKLEVARRRERRTAILIFIGAVVLGTIAGIAVTLLTLHFFG